MAKPILVSAPARLHFGLFSIGNSLEYQFGGCGLMIDGPRTIVAAQPAYRLNFSGHESETARETIEHWFHLNASLLESDLNIRSVDQIPLAIDIRRTPDRHAGFGSGTQLALSIVSAAVTSLGLPQLSAQDLAIATGRGKRSAIGSHGFLQGGFLVDRGKRAGDLVAPLELRLDFPDDWPIVIIKPKNAHGLSGTLEKKAFEDLPDSSNADRDAMTNLVKSEIVTGIINRDYSRFAKGVYSFGHQSGMMFEPLQGGAYNGEITGKIVDAVREYGIEAVGQSSWGPCVFAIASDEAKAQSLSDHLGKLFSPESEVTVRRADNRGAFISQLE